MAKVDDIIQRMILAKDASTLDILQYVKGNCREDALTPQTLGMLFELYVGMNPDNDVLSNQDTSNQKQSDFQPLSKAANDAKRSHCAKCIKTGKRYDATSLGYSQGFILGDENTKTCQGCYWYDPKYFNKIISTDYKKDK